VCENRGSGIRSILDALLSAGMSPPQFEDRISSFMVTFPNRTLLCEETLRWMTGLGDHGLHRHPVRRTGNAPRGRDTGQHRGYRTATGVDSRVATTELQDLAARELVTQTGTRRWAQYRLSPRLAPRADGVALGGGSASSIARRFTDETPSRAELAARTGLNEQTVRRWLTIMREEGTVELAGSRPRSTNAPYRRARQGSLFTDDRN